MSASGPTFLVVVLYWVLTALYGAIASQPFVQEQFLAPRLFGPLAFFADWHVPLGLVSLAAWAVARRIGVGGRPSVRTIVAGLASLAAIGVVGFAAPLAELQTIASSLTAVGAGVAAIVALAVAELRPPGVERPAARQDRSFADLAACLVAGAGVALVHLTAAALVGGVPASPTAEILHGVRLHLLLAGGTFLALAAIRAAAALTPRPVAFEAVLTAVGLAIAVSLFLFHAGLASISIRGATAAAMSSGIGAALAFAACARGPKGDALRDDGIIAALGALTPRIASTWWGFGLWLVALTALAVVVAAASRAADWNFVLLRSGVAVTWLLALPAALVLSSRFPSRGAAVSFSAAALILAGHVALQSGGAPVLASSLASPSARWLADAFERRGQPDAAGNLVALLHARTNIPRDTKVDAVDVTLAALSGPPSAERPHVFVFAVDSLRRDYLSPYNPAVTFTPSIAALAQDSLVFRNAFTQYGATGLSVPALWVGGPILHKQYVTPFAPMNSLSKLLAHERYAQWIGMDNIMNAILPASDERDPLDHDVAVKDFRLCRTLDDVRSRLAARTSSDEPVFVYSLPQDVHVSVVAREGARSVDERSYDGFYAPVASRIARLDACLGAFLADLKERGLYDQSIVILTSDHGDSLGEEGRMGHAYSLHPEVIRVPLIAHVPPALRARWMWDEGRAAYTTDLTPTLYRLLGHQVEAPATFFGESLARPHGAPPPAARDRMVAASYGAVYGALLDGATHYYVFDAIAMREMAFALGSGPEPGASIPVTPDIRLRGQSVIRQTVDALSAFYRFPRSSAAE